MGGSQQPHEQLQVGALQSGEEGQQGGVWEEEGAAIGQEEIHQKILEPRGGASHKLGLEVVEAGKPPPGQRLNGLVQGDALPDFIQQLPQALQGLLGVQALGEVAAGNDRAQIQRSQRPRDRTALRGVVLERCQDFLRAGGLIQPQLR